MTKYAPIVSAGYRMVWYILTLRGASLHVVPVHCCRANIIHAIMLNVLINTYPTVQPGSHFTDFIFQLEGEKEMQDIAEDLAIVFETVVGSKGRLSPGEYC